ncbi:uncharacterized protein LOC134850866 isoform X4 [Symsagittifera roscoffensis]|uniref:uncharacterized protein LOC134850866 isoform X4 n=1 Tax=Symsagittifera roscoffensis TaxID=84072 RepID=UPI00307BE70E
MPAAIGTSANRKYKTTVSFQDNDDSFDKDIPPRSNKSAELRKRHIETSPLPYSRSSTSLNNFYFDPKRGIWSEYHDSFLPDHLGDLKYGGSMPRLNKSERGAVGRSTSSGRSPGNRSLSRHSSGASVSSRPFYADSPLSQNSPVVNFQKAVEHSPSDWLEGRLKELPCVDMGKQLPTVNSKYNHPSYNKQIGKPRRGRSSNPRCALNAQCAHSTGDLVLVTQSENFDDARNLNLAQDTLKLNRSPIRRNGNSDGTLNTVHRAELEPEERDQEFNDGVIDEEESENGSDERANQEEVNWSPVRDHRQEEPGKSSETESEELSSPEDEPDNDGSQRFVNDQPQSASVNPSRNEPRGFQKKGDDKLSGLKKSDHNVTKTNWFRESLSIAVLNSLERAKKANSHYVHHFNRTLETVNVNSAYVPTCEVIEQQEVTCFISPPNSSVGSCGHVSSDSCQVCCELQKFDHFMKCLCRVLDDINSQKAALKPTSQRPTTLDPQTSTESLRHPQAEPVEPRKQLMIDTGDHLAPREFLDKKNKIEGLLKVKSEEKMEGAGAEKREEEKEKGEDDEKDCGTPALKSHRPRQEYITDIPTDFNNGSKKLNVPESDKPMIVADTEAAKGKPREVETENSFEKSDEKDQDEDLEIYPVIRETRGAGHGHQFPTNTRPIRNGNLSPFKDTKPSKQGPVDERNEFNAPRSLGCFDQEVEKRNPLFVDRRDGLQNSTYPTKNTYKVSGNLPVAPSDNRDQRYGEDEVPVETSEEDLPSNLFQPDIRSFKKQSTENLSSENESDSVATFIPHYGNRGSQVGSPSEWSEEDPGPGKNPGAKPKKAEKNVPLMTSEMKVYLNYLDDDEYTSEGDIIAKDGDVIRETADVELSGGNSDAMNDPQEGSDSELEYDFKVNDLDKTEQRTYSKPLSKNHTDRSNDYHQISFSPLTKRRKEHEPKTKTSKLPERPPENKRGEKTHDVYDHKRPYTKQNKKEISPTRANSLSQTPNKPILAEEITESYRKTNYYKKSNSKLKQLGTQEPSSEKSSTLFTPGKAKPKFSRGFSEENIPRPVRKPSASNKIHSNQKPSPSENKLFGRKVGKFVPDLEDDELMLENEDKFGQSLNAQTDLSHIFDFDENEIGTKVVKEVAPSKSDFELVKNLFDTRLIYADNDETDGRKARQKSKDFGRISKGLVDKLRAHFDSKERKARKELDFYRLIHGELQNRHESMREWDPILRSPYDESFVQRYQYRYHVRESRILHSRSVSMSRTPIDLDFIERGKYRYIVRAPRDDNSFSLATSLMNTPAASMIDVRSRKRSAGQNDSRVLREANIIRTMSSSGGLDYYRHKHSKQISDPVHKNYTRYLVKDIYQDYDMLPPPVDELKPRKFENSDQPDQFISGDLPDAPVSERFLALTSSNDDRIYSSNLELSTPMKRESDREPWEFNHQRSSSRSEQYYESQKRSKLSNVQESNIREEVLMTSRNPRYPNDQDSVSNKKGRASSSSYKVQASSSSSAVSIKREEKQQKSRQEMRNLNVSDTDGNENYASVKRSPRNDPSINGTDKLKSKHKGFVDRGIERFESQEALNKTIRRESLERKNALKDRKNKPREPNHPLQTSQNAFVEPRRPNSNMSDYIRPPAEKYPVNHPKKEPIREIKKDQIKKPENDLQKFVEEAPCDKTSRLTAFYSPKGYNQSNSNEISMPNEPAKDADEKQAKQSEQLAFHQNTREQIPGSRMIKYDPFHEDHTTLLKHENESYFAHNPITGRTVQLDGMDSLSDVTHSEPTFLIKTVQRTTEERLIHIESVDDLNKIQIDDSIRDHANRLAELRPATLNRDNNDSQRNQQRYRRFVPKESNKQQAKYKSYESLSQQHSYDSSSLLLTQERSRSLNELNSANQEMNRLENQMRRREKAEHSQTEEDMESPLYQHDSSSVENLVDTDNFSLRRENGKKSDNQNSSPGNTLNSFLGSPKKSPSREKVIKRASRDSVASGSSLHRSPARVPNSRNPQSKSPYSSTNSLAKASASENPAMQNYGTYPTSQKHNGQQKAETKPKEQEAESYDPNVIRAEVLYNFKPYTPRELEAKRGDVISLLSRVDANWVEARLEKGNNNKNDNSNRVGLIPVTYIKVIQSDHSVAPKANQQQASEPVARATNHHPPHHHLQQQKNNYPNNLNYVDSQQSKNSAILKPIQQLQVQSQPNENAASSRQSSPSSQLIYQNIENSKSRNRPQHQSEEFIEPKKQGQPLMNGNNFQRQNKQNVQKDQSQKSVPNGASNAVKKSDSLVRKGRVIYDFDAQTDVELQLKKNQVVTIRKQVDENWFDGYIGQRRGIFPISYVEVISDEMEDAPDKARRMQNQKGSQNNLTQSNNDISANHTQPHGGNKGLEYFRVMHDFSPKHADELQLMKGDVILVVEQCSDGWFAGKSTKTGQFGLFPGNYVVKMN